MAFVFSFPDVGEGIHEGQVVEWLVAEGAMVAEDQPLVKVETDKAVVELPSPRAGIVATLHVAAGATIHVGDPLVTITESGEQRAVGAELASARDVRASSVRGAVSGNRRPLATPRTRALARRLGVDLTALTGTGSGGRITDEDVERAAQAATAPAPVARLASAPAPLTKGSGELVERVPLTHLRKTIAAAMRASVATAAHVTHVDEADVTDLVAHYKAAKGRIEEQQGVRFTLLPFFVRAVVAALKQHPLFNASVDEEREELLLKHYYNIGVAVDTEQGLIVPVLKDADRKDLLVMARELADLAERARSRQLTLEELRDATCTITNIGPLGGVFATPIIPQPQLAIVGLHTIKERPAVVAGQIVPRQLMYLSVSFDHRWVDGAAAARFMTDLVQLVSNPALLMVRL